MSLKICSSFLSRYYPTPRLVAFLIFLGLVNFLPCGQAIYQKPIVIVSTSYNNSDWLERNILSLVSQRYSNFRVIYVDDCSTDGTADKVESLLKKCRHVPPFTLIRNQVRRGTVANMYDAIHSCEDGELIVSVDGDDWLLDNTVLQKINQAYYNSDIWLTHGTLQEYPNGAIAWCLPIPAEIIQENLFRTFRCPTHLRTFYAWLFKKIDVNDLMFNGEFLQMTGDMAIMFPMIEMAGHRHKFINEVLYVYNMKNPLNDNKVDPKLQNDMDAYIRSKPPYTPLKTE